MIRTPLKTTVVSEHAAYCNSLRVLAELWDDLKGMSDVANAAAAMGEFDGSDAGIATAVAAIDGFHEAALNPNSGEFLMPVVGVLDDPFSVA